MGISGFTSPEFYLQGQVAALGTDNIRNLSSNVIVNINIGDASAYTKYV